MKLFWQFSIKSLKLSTLSAFKKTMSQKAKNDLNLINYIFVNNTINLTLQKIQIIDVSLHNGL